MLNGYAPLGHPETLMKNKKQYTVQRYQGKHKNEFLLHCETGDAFLYESNVLKQYWRESENGMKSEEFIRYKNGRVDFSQRFQDILEQMNSKRIVYHKKGLRMEIWSAKTGHLLYHGKYNERQMREGWGIEYDEESGNAVVEGIWSQGRLIEVIRCFNGDTMTELKRNGSDSLDSTKRIPIYVGGFRYDEDNETFIREGKGCLIDEMSGIAYQEGEWKDGVERSQIILRNGCYNPKLMCSLATATNRKPASLPATKLTINESTDLENIGVEVTDLTISSKCYNDLRALDLNKFEWLRSIEIGDDCFGSVQTFKIDGLNRLKSLKIGKNSFTALKESNWTYEQGINKWKSFHILNCESLESIEIGQYSFSDFAGEFELKNLPQLQSIQIGIIGSYSSNFFCSSFVIRGIYMIMNI